MKTFLALAVLGLFASQLRADEEFDFGEQIQPIFLEHCAKCHGKEKESGGLRLHTAESIDEFGLDYLLAPGKPDESEILRRISLPEDDDEFMPKSGKPLPEETITLIRTWIEQGAKISVTASGEANEQEPAAEPIVVEPASPETIDRLTATGAQVLALFSGSPLLRVSFAYASEPVGNEQVEMLAEVAPQVVWLNLTRTEVTDAGTAPLAVLENLTHLHLENTAITDDALMHIAGLMRLEYLNLYGTGVTDAGLQYLKDLKNLKRLYLWQTGVSYDAAMALQETISGLEVNLGWNHPEVAKARITTELERVTKQAEEAAHREEVARQEKELAAERKSALEKELAELLGESTDSEDAAEDASNTTEEATAEPVQRDKEKEDPPDEKDSPQASTEASEKPAD